MAWRQIKQTFGASTECGKIPRPAGAPPAPAGKYTPRSRNLVRFSHIFHRKPQGAADSLDTRPISYIC